MTMVSLLGLGTAWAQPVNVTIVPPVAAGDCVVMVQFTTPPAAGTGVVLQLDKNRLPEVSAKGKQTVPVWLKAPLAEKNVLQVQAVVAGVLGPTSPPVDVTAGTGPAQCPSPGLPQQDDERDAILVTAYLGEAFDNFAPGKVGGYRDGTESTQRSRFIAGVDFEYRLLGNRGDDVQLWLAGETLHGVRSADVDCSVEPKPALCDRNGSQTDRFIATLRGATSLEAYVTPRLELATLQRGTGAASKFYVTGRLGVMSLEGAPHSFAAHHVGAGLTSTVGPFSGSFLEVGWGRTDLFLPEFGAASGRWNRLKIDSLVSFPLLSAFMDRAKNWKRAPRMFVQLYSDFDPGDNAADSLQTFVGIDFDLSGILR